MGKSPDCSVCQLLWCKYFYHDQLCAKNVTALKAKWGRDVNDGLLQACASGLQTHSSSGRPGQRFPSHDPGWTLMGEQQEGEARNQSRETGGNQKRWASFPCWELWTLHQPGWSKLCNLLASPWGAFRKLQWLAYIQINEINFGVWRSTYRIAPKSPQVILRCWALKCVYDSLKEILWVHKFEEFGDTRGQGFIYRWAFSQVRFCSPFFLITGARLHPGLLESLPWPSILNITRIFSTNTSMSKKDFLNTWLDLITYLSSLSLSLVFWN